MEANEEAVATATMAEVEVDEEALFMASGKETGNEWELFKENVRPLKRGRNVALLNHALRSHIDPALRSHLLLSRRRMIEAIGEYQGDDPLQPWLDCIKWVQESFPSGGECSGLVVIYEQCVRTFWHDDRYKDDLRYLKVWMEYVSNCIKGCSSIRSAENCADSEVIYSFLEANQIGQNHAIYYTSYALCMEFKNKLRKADKIFNLGIARRAEPVEKLEAQYRTFLVRSVQKQQSNEDEPTNNHLPVRSFGTVLTPGQGRQTLERQTLGRQPIEASNFTRPKVKLQRVDNNKALSIYNDENAATSQHHNKAKSNDRTWCTLGTQSDRNKENTSIPTNGHHIRFSRKWEQEQCNQHLVLVLRLPKVEVATKSSNATSILKLRQVTSQNLKKVKLCGWSVSLAELWHLIDRVKAPPTPTRWPKSVVAYNKRQEGPCKTAGVCNCLPSTEHAATARPHPALLKQGTRENERKLRNMPRARTRALQSLVG
ncbi:Mitotic spindle checkpoint protein BUBR1 [Ananas comosus]|uniref:Mitotic spindle checkpoint protein BUBR1 n=1 Tax=Ananas comosus TaxID=4615 RepID=A0A199VGW7_ANACO|nr:Mitotic spindle checkpoint protein BUBR1 [Ananas comosus]